MLVIPKGFPEPVKEALKRLEIDFIAKKDLLKLIKGFEKKK